MPKEPIFITQLAEIIRLNLGENLLTKNMQDRLDKKINFISLKNYIFQNIKNKTIARIQEQKLEEENEILINQQKINRVTNFYQSFIKYFKKNYLPKDTKLEEDLSLLYVTEYDGINKAKFRLSFSNPFVLRVHTEKERTYTVPYTSKYLIILMSGAGGNGGRGGNGGHGGEGGGQGEIFRPLTKGGNGGNGGNGGEGSDGGKMFIKLFFFEKGQEIKYKLGKKGVHGKDGKDGKDGKKGKEFHDGENGQYGTDGEDGTNGEESYIEIPIHKQGIWQTEKFSTENENYISLLKGMQGLKGRGGSRGSGGTNITNDDRGSSGINGNDGTGRNSKDELDYERKTLFNTGSSKYVNFSGIFNESISSISDSLIIIWPLGL